MARSLLHVYHIGAGHTAKLAISGIEHVYNIGRNVTKKRLIEILESKDIDGVAIYIYI